MGARWHVLVAVVVVVSALVSAEAAHASGGIKPGEYTARFKVTPSTASDDCESQNSQGTFKFSVQVLGDDIILVPRENFPAAKPIVMAKDGLTLSGELTPAANDTPATIVALTFKGKKVTGVIAGDAPCSSRVSFQGTWKRKSTKLVTRREIEPEIEFVAVAIKGAVIGPVDQNGAAWDGPGFSKTDIKTFSKLVVGQFPIGKTPLLGGAIKDFASDLVTAIVTAFDAPDPKGTATVLVNDVEQGSASLDIRHDIFTPTWDVVLPTVSLRGAEVVVRLVDTDIVDDDPITALSIPESVLSQAALSGDAYTLDVSVPSGDMVYRLFIAVTVVPAP